MRNPYSIIFLIVALAFMFAAGAFKGFFFPILILFFAYRYSIRHSKDNPDRPAQRDSRRYDPRSRRRSNTDNDNRREYQAPVPKPIPIPRKRPNPYKKSGVEKYKDYEYEGAIADFKKALEINPNDIPTHFNIACAYSLTEDKEKAFYHLDKAVEIGYKDFDKIQTHDAFAFIRIQDEFEHFVENGYRLTENQKALADDEDISNPDLLEKLKKLADLRENGILTEEEFLTQKEKLLR